MTVSTNTPRQRFTGNGVTVTFAVPFTFTANSEVIVILRSSAGVETVQTNPANYSISGTNVVMVTAPASGAFLVIMRDEPYSQLVDLTASGPFDAADVEGALDACVKLIQQLYEKLRRVPQIKRTVAAAGLDLEFPEPSANGLLSWNAAGTALVNLPQTGLLLTQNQYRSGTSAIGAGAQSLDVVFSTAMDDANYSVAPGMSNLTDANPDFQNVTVTAKSTTGFTAKWNDPTDTANYSLEWEALGHA